MPNPERPLRHAAQEPAQPESLGETVVTAYPVAFVDDGDGGYADEWRYDLVCRCGWRGMLWEGDPCVCPGCSALIEDVCALAASRTRGLSEGQAAELRGAGGTYMLA